MRRNYVAVIQGGGKGTRMVSLTHDRIPKPMLPLNGKPMLAWQIEDIAAYGIKEFIIIIGHLGEKIKEYFGDGAYHGVTIQYIEEEEPLGSAGALYYLKRMYPDRDFIFVFGDVMFCLDWARMLSFHEEKRAEATLLAHPNSHPYDSDLLLLGKDGAVLGIDEKGNHRDYWYANCVNAGIYVLDRKFIRQFIKLEKRDLEKDVLLTRIHEGKIFAYLTPEYVKDAGTPERFAQAAEEQRRGIWEAKCLKNSQKCIFLDRDGTINRYNGLIYREEQLVLEEGAAEAIRKINQSEYLAIAVTNQPVVARGLCDMTDLEDIHKKLETLLGERGAYLDAIMFCPHHPDRGYPEENPLYKIPCNCRKPKIGMIEDMAEKFHIDLSASCMVGDSTVDIKTGINAGLKTVLVKTGQAGKDGKHEARADREAENLLEAVTMILKGI